MNHTRRGLLLLAGLLCVMPPVLAQVKIEKRDFAGWPNSYWVGNGRLELVVTSDVGPRVISLRLGEGPNLFSVREDFAGQTGGEEWRNYGGHRLWHAPEEKVRTYQPDNAPVQVETLADGLRLTAAVEAKTGIRKSIEIKLDPTQPRVTVLHRLTNAGLWPVRLAPWAISVMAPGGFGISPLPTRFHPDRLLPNRTLVLWPYTDLRDDRYYVGTDLVMLRHRAGIDPARERAKIGVANDEGWCAYAREGYLFLKRFPFTEGAAYPDLGASVELFTNNRMLEVETLGPLVDLAPGATVTHQEEWEVWDGIPLPFGDEAAIRARLLPLVERGRARGNR